MYIIVGGGGQVGYYLAQGLIEQGHEVALLDKDPRRTEQLKKELGASIIRGDACEAQVLEALGCARAEIVIALTRDDEDTLVICQVAKTRFHVPQTIARVNNPRNEALFRELGIDLIVSPTQSILHSIEVQIPHHTLVPLVSLTRAGLSLVELTVPSRSPAAGRTIRELELPSSANIVLIERGTEPLTPSGETELQEEDHLFALVTDDGERSLREHILTEAEAS